MSLLVWVVSLPEWSCTACTLAEMLSVHTYLWPFEQVARLVHRTEADSGLLA